MTQIYFDWDDHLSSNLKFILIGCGGLFILLPLIGNLFQLHNEIEIWVCDVYSKHTIQPWVRSYLRFLYMLAILFGSAFAAVDVCNSNLFYLPMFSMGLNKRQKAIFKNQRLLSTVLFENIPQVILQLIYSYLTEQITLVTLVAIGFSSISIISSIFDYKSSSLLLQCETITLIEMNIESHQLANTKYQKFEQLITRHRNPICHELSKIIGVHWRLIEILTPIQMKTGAKLVFYIRSNDSSDKNFSSTIVNTIRNEIDSDELANVCCVLLTSFILIRRMFVLGLVSS